MGLDDVGSKKRQPEDSAEVGFVDTFGTGANRIPAGEEIFLSNATRPYVLRPGLRS